MPNITYVNSAGKEVTEEATVSYSGKDPVKQSQLVLSTSIAEATFEIFAHELFDKTFILMIIFTISWTNWETEN